MTAEMRRYRTVIGEGVEGWTEEDRVGSLGWRIRFGAAVEHD